jgi:DNA replication factor GINS
LFAGVEQRFYIMYDILLELWRKEFECRELVRLPPDFYSQIAGYLKRLREEERMTDKKTLKASLLKAEMNEIRRIFSHLTRIRYRKMVRFFIEGKEIPPDVLADHERNLLAKKNLSLADIFKKLTDNVLSGSLDEGFAEKPKKVVMVRFLKDIPAIVGVDLKTYGPFKCEDVASLPAENARILIKQKLAKEVEI